jgi:hypothetical protein
MLLITDTCLQEIQRFITEVPDRTLTYFCLVSLLLKFKKEALLRHKYLQPFTRETETVILWAKIIWACLKEIFICEFILFDG